MKDLLLRPQLGLKYELIHNEQSKAACANLRIQARLERTRQQRLIRRLSALWLVSWK